MKVKDKIFFIIIFIALIFAGFCSYSPARAESNISIGGMLLHDTNHVESVTALFDYNKDIFYLSGGYMYGRVNNETNINRRNIKACFDQDIDFENWSVWAFDEYINNHAIKIKENLFGMGYKYTFLSNKSIKLSLSVGYLFHSLHAEEYHGVIHRLSIRPKLWLKNKFFEAGAFCFYQPQLAHGDIEKYIVKGEAYIQKNITEKLSFKLQLFEEYWNDLDKNFTKTAILLNYRF